MENGGMGPLGNPPQVPLDLKNGQNSGKLAKFSALQDFRGTLTYQSFPVGVVKDVQVDNGGLGSLGGPLEAF